MSEADAKAAVESINREIDKCYALHSQQLATRGDVESIRKDMAELKTELVKAIAKSQRWTITSIFAAVALFAAITKIWH